MLQAEYFKCLLVFAFCFRYAASIRCFDCNSMNNSMCLDPTIYDKETLNNFLPIAECGHGVYSANNDFFCRKIVQTIPHKGEVRVTRSSGWVYHHRSILGRDYIFDMFPSLFFLHKGYEPEVRVTRSCGWVRYKAPCYKADNEDHLETVCQCFDNECNAAGPLKSVLVMVVGVFGAMMCL